MVAEVIWMRTTPACPAAIALADRHYPRRKSGIGKQMAPPGRKLILVTPRGDAVWGSLDQKPEATKHAWPGAWVCFIFRNESRHLSSDLIRAAVKETIARWGRIPPTGFITFVDAEATVRRRSKRALPGECFRRAGWREVGRTPGGHGRSSKVVLMLGGPQ